MNEPDKALRRFVAAEHGLEPTAAKFLNGATVAELEESAAALAKLLGGRRQQKRAIVPSDPFTDMATEKAGRKAALAAIFTGRVPQARDENGRFAASFDGGARQPVPLEPESHEQTLSRVLRTGEADAGARF